MRKKMIILLQLMIAIVLVATSVYAVVTTTIEVTPSTSKLKRGEEVTVTLSLKDVDSEKKVSSVKGYINYNSDVIEKLTVDSIVKNSENKVNIADQELSVEDLTNATIDDMTSSHSYVGFNGNPASDNDTVIVIDFGKDVSQDTDLITMKFKVKSTATIGEIENAIEYKAFIITAGDEESEEISKNLQLTIEDVTPPVDDDNNDTNSNTDNKNNTTENTTNSNKNTTNTDKNNTNKNTTNNQPNTNTNKNTDKNANKASNTTNNTVDNTVAGKILPATGAKVLIIPAIILIIVAYVTYHKYMKYKQI